ncbi:MAG: formylglycine-generating enzyme family protein [Kiritimatiellia bacterium]
MKTLAFGLALVCAAGASATPVVNVQLLRQQRPWSQHIAVDFTVTGLSPRGAAALTARAYDGTTDLGVIPEAAIAGWQTSFDAERTYHVEIDPSKCPFATQGTIRNFRVVFTATESPYSAEPLYRIVDLTDGSCEDITEADVANGRWGSFETHPAWLQEGVIAALGGSTLFLTGVTNDASFLDTKLLLRRMKAGTYAVGTTGNSAYPVHNAAFTQDYWIGVFEITFAQWNRITGGSLSDTYMSRPVQGGTTVTYDTVRGKAADNAAYDWPTGRQVAPDSFMGKLRALTGLDFDLPTEEQWAAAAYAGAAGATHYDGSSSTSNDSTNPVWYLGRGNPNGTSTGTPSGGTALPGCYWPNGYGLYDIIGNVREMVLDWYAAGNIAAAATLTDWEGPSTGTYRGVKGGCAGHSISGGLVLTGRYSSDIEPGKCAGNTGFRVCLTEK